MKLKESKFDIAVNLFCLLMLLGITVYLITSWNTFSDKIPTHFNAAGVVDSWGSRSALLFPPILTWALYIGLSVVGRFPNIWNTGVVVTNENKEKVYRILKNMLGSLKLDIVVIFSFLTLNMASAKALPGWFLPAVLLLMFGPITFFIVKLNRSK